MQEQTDIFGRRKYSGAPMDGKKEGDTADFAKDPDGKITPKDSHMRLANPPRSGVHEKTPALPPRLQLLARPRRQRPARRRPDFICYQANLADGFIFVQNLLNGEPLEEYISRLAAAISSSCRVSKKAASSAKSFWAYKSADGLNR